MEGGIIIAQLYLFIISFFIYTLLIAVACKKIMSLFDENFHKVLLKLIDSPHKEVQYNCAGIIGHLAMNGE